MREEKMLVWSSAALLSLVAFCELLHPILAWLGHPCSPDWNYVEGGLVLASVSLLVPMACFWLCHRRIWGMEDMPLALRVLSALMGLGGVVLTLWGLVRLVF